MTTDRPDAPRGGRRKANGEGTIFQRKDGRWCAAYHATLPGGRQQRQYVYGRTWQEVHDKLTEAKARARQGLPATPAGLTVAVHLDEWLAHIRDRVRPSTYAGYETMVRLHVKPRLGRKRLAALTARDVRRMVDGMRADGAKPRLVQYAHATLRAALTHAVREEIISRNVAMLVHVPGTSKDDDDTSALTPEQAKTLLESVRTHRLYALFVLTLLLGLRRSEALGLRWDDVDLAATGTLQVRRGLHRVGGELAFLPTKTRRSRRTVPLPHLCVQALTDHAVRQDTERRTARCWEDSGLIFTTGRGTPIEPRRYTALFQQACRDAGVPVIRLHALRHTCVTLLLNLGVPPRVVMEIVGHSTLEMTMNVYAHVSLDAQREAMAKLNELFIGSPATPGNPSERDEGDSNPQDRAAG